MSGPLSRVDWVAREIRNAILDGTFQPDTHLQAKELASLWGVSPTPVREAFGQLAVQGFLDHSSHRGTRVSRVSPEEFTELYDLRVEVEPAALKHSIERGGEAWRRDVAATWAVLREASKSSDPYDDRYREAHRAWHAAIVSAAGSSWWPRTVESLREQSERYLVLGLTPRSLKDVKREHNAIQKATLAGESEAAADLLRQHIAESQQYVVQQLDARVA